MWCVSTINTGFLSVKCVQEVIECAVSLFARHFSLNRKIPHSRVDIKFLQHLSSYTIMRSFCEVFFTGLETVLSRNLYNYRGERRPWIILTSKVSPAARTSAEAVHWAWRVEFTQFIVLWQITDHILRPSNRYFALDRSFRDDAGGC